MPVPLCPAGFCYYCGLPLWQRGWPWACPFLGMHGHFVFLPQIQLFLYVLLCLISGLWKRKREKWWGPQADVMVPSMPWSHYSQKLRDLQQHGTGQQWPHLSRRTFEIRMGNQRSEPRFWTVGELVLLHPLIPTHCSFACLRPRGERWVAVTMLRGERHWPKLVRVKDH